MIFFLIVREDKRVNNPNIKEKYLLVLFKTLTLYTFNELFFSFIWRLLTKPFIFTFITTILSINRHFLTHYIYFYKVFIFPILILYFYKKSTNFSKFFTLCYFTTLKCLEFKFCVF